MRWPVIIFSRITSLGEVYDVFTFCEPKENLTSYFDVRDSNVGCAFIYPSLTADIRLAAYDNVGVKAASYPPAALAAYSFLVYVRGLPIDEAEIETPDGIFKTIRVGNDEKCEIILRKCKQLRINLPIEVQNTTILCTTLKTDVGIVRVARCENSEMVSDYVLRELTLSSDGENIRGALLYSENGDGITVRRYFIENDGKCLDFISAHAVATLACGFKHSDLPLKITVGKNEFFSRHIGTRLAFSSTSLRPMVFPFSDSP